MSSSPKVESSARGALVVGGGSRLPREQEIALNILLLRAGGEEGGKQLYRLGWAMEDNHSTWDPSRGDFVYDPLKKTPVCFHPNQASYHLLSWAPPAPAEYQSQFVGEDTSQGSYECIFHFLDPETNEPIQPTAALAERIIPMIKEMHEIAFASRQGFEATRNSLRQKRIDSIKDDEKKKQIKYEAYAESVLESSAPAFEGNPTSFPGAKRQSFSDLQPGERRPQITLTDGDAPAPVETPQPTEFSFSAKSRSPRQ